MSGGIFPAIHVSRENDLKNALVLYGIDYIPDHLAREKELKFIGSIVQSCRNLRSTGSSGFDTCYTASGKTGACIAQTGKIWDVVPCYHLIISAGGVCSEVSGTKLVFESNKANYLRNFTYLAAAPDLYAKLLLLYKSAYRL
ncbi:MAG: Inositol monophosphatase/fructose-1,6-bisphosphatase family protein [Candidatus Gottesmanbacteria bacterium GW2011_GWA2_42_16]|nr:MAG: Inositol monophosphatase/fructose-1,6-bisphosphatase family protein [Candidatus Gottesmanbacteria bacterium GW2011_GWA2_42_16]